MWELLAAVARIMNSEEIEAPILQILGVKKIITEESELIRILISDAMLSTHLNLPCEEEQLKRVFIVMGLTVLHPGDHKIGEPVNPLDAPVSSAQKAAPTPTSLPSTSNNKSKPAKENRSFSNGNSKNTNLDQSMNAGLISPIASLSPYHNNKRTTNKEFKKRDPVLIDISDAAVTLTIWGEDAVNFDGQVQLVILVKGARNNEFNGGKSLSLGNGSNMKINPDIPEGYKLRGWFDNGGWEYIKNSVSAHASAIGGSAEWRTFLEARNLGRGDKPDYFQTKVVINVLVDLLSYLLTFDAYHRAGNHQRHGHPTFQDDLVFDLRL
uniref:Replication protein A OB domain-containing protein n=1 Tax=Glossina palpalis gambiensis TaxID=67801 RepID=A0A1B0C533_9MUSC